MRILVLLIAVLGLSVGLPLAAVRWSQARSFHRPVPPSYIDVLHTEARRKGLTLRQIDAVSRAVDRGEPAPPALQPLAAQVAAAKLATMRKAIRPGRRTRRALVLIVCISLTSTVVIATVKRDVALGLVPALEFAVIATLMRFNWRRQLHRTQRAIDVNRAEPTSLT